jgi:type IV pilus assembly protein PilF
MYKKIITLLFLLTLTACSSVQPTPDRDEQDKIAKKIKTAKINAQLGIAYLEQNNVQRAKKKLLTAMEQAPNIPEVWYSMAYFLETTGEKNEAEKHYLKAIALSPARGDSHNNYGTFLCREGKYKNAEEQFQLAVKDPNYLSPADAFENAGLCSLSAKDNQLAANYFARAIMYDPSRPTSLINLAQINFKDGKYEDAKKRLNQFLAISPPTTQSKKLSEKFENVTPLKA